VGKGDRPARHHGERLHGIGEAIDLDAIDLIAGEGAGQGVNRDILGLDVARGFEQLPIEGGHLYPAALAGGGA
jgi:hypothetical protein